MNKHGEFLFSWDKNILIIHAKGPFNEEGAIAETNKIKKFILKKNVTKWCKLGMWDNESLGSPKAIEIVKSYHQWCVEKGCIQTAYVVCNSLQVRISDRIYNSTAKIFNNEPDAIEWLRSHLENE